MFMVMFLFVWNLFGSAAFASNTEPMATNYVTASASISITGSTVKTSGAVVGVLGKTTKTAIHLYLQQYRNGRWESIDDWRSSGNTESRSLSKSKIVTKGYTYRTKAVCSAYIGSSKETVTKYSNAISY